MRDCKQLKIWKEGHEVALSAYMVTSDFPKEEIYDLTSPMRPSAGSTPNNLAKGCGRATESELPSFKN